MGRNYKIGLDYFPVDVTFFDDDKIQLISGEFGHKGEYITLRLLAKIYSTNGYYYQWGSDESLLFAKRVGDSVTGALVNEIVSRLVARGFFDESIYSSLKILTSRGIQKRYFSICERRKSIDVIEEILLVNPSDFDNVYINTINDNINDINYIKSTQSKVKRKYSTEKERESHKCELIFPFDSDAFKIKWELWKKYKLQQHNFKFKSEISEQAALKQLADLAAGDEATALAIIDQSINFGWKGFFELKKTDNGHRKNTVRTYTADDFKD